MVGLVHEQSTTLSYISNVMDVLDKNDMKALIS